MFLIDNNRNPSLYPPKWNKPESELLIEVSAKVNFSESQEKVTKAIKNIFPELDITLEKDDIISGKSSDERILFNLCKNIYSQQILDVARKCVLDGIVDSSSKEPTKKLQFYLNKQIAYKNKVNFSSPTESPLGPIVITIVTQEKDSELFIDTYFPKFEWFSKNNEE